MPPEFGFSAFPTKALPEIPKIREVGDANRAEYITACSQRKRVLALLFPVPHFLSGTPPQIFLPNYRKLALTKFFVLSNIRSVSGGSSEMLRTSRCFRKQLLQSAGTRTLATVAPFLHSLSIDSKKTLRPRAEMNDSPHRGTVDGFSSACAERLLRVEDPRRMVFDSSSVNRPATIRGKGRQLSLSAANLFR